METKLIEGTTYICTARLSSLGRAAKVKIIEVTEASVYFENVDGQAKERLTIEGFFNQWRCVETINETTKPFIDKNPTWPMGHFHCAGPYIANQMPAASQNTAFPNPNQQ